jgi:hypothetical protein
VQAKLHSENLKGREILRDIKGDGHIINWIFEKKCKNVKIIYLVQDIDQWRALVNVVISLWVS